MSATSPGMAVANGGHTMRAPTMFSAVLVIALWLPSAVTLAQGSAHDEEARSLFEAGRAAFAEGRYDDALERFAEAHELSGRPELLYNVGVSADRLRRDEEAVRAFRAYLEAVPAAAERAEVQARIEILERAIAERARAAVPEPEPEPQISPQPLPLPPPPPATTTSRDATGQTTAIAGGVVAAVGLVLGAVFGGLALATDGALTSECGTHCSDAQLDELFRDTVLADASVGVALAGAVVFSVGLAIDASTPDQPVTLVLAPVPGGATLAVRGRLP